MKTIFYFFISVSIIFASGLDQQTDDVQELESLLHWFLENASDYDTHVRFWDDHLIYTSAAGERFGKNELLSGLQQNQNQQNQNLDTAAYSGDRVQVRLYGDTAVVAFRLIAELPHESALEPADRMTFFNTGTFIRNNGEWRAVAWQATRIPD